jgi:hypothetical protein
LRLPAQEMAEFRPVERDRRTTALKEPARKAKD